MLISFNLEKIRRFFIWKKFSNFVELKIASNNFQLVYIISLLHYF
jgi:hypothetical protein